jgi:hypothetical protein
VEECDHEVVLGRKVPVEDHLRHARLGDDAVHPDRPDAVAGEEPRPSSRRPRLIRLAVLISSSTMSTRMTEQASHPKMSI